MGRCEVFTASAIAMPDLRSEEIAEQGAVRRRLDIAWLGPKHPVPISNRVLLGKYQRPLIPLRSGASTSQPRYHFDALCREPTPAGENRENLATIYIVRGCSYGVKRTYTT